MKLHLIWAQARNGVIGAQGKMPWHLPEDLAHFKATTLGCPVIMGRKTWQSIPARYRPLPGRVNIVLTQQSNWHDAGALPARDIAHALAQCSTLPDIHTAWVIGGAQVYAQALPYAQSVVVTEIDADFEGDAYAPTLDSHWHCDAKQTFTSATGLRYSICVYNKR